jgi:hypothetical protein
MKTAKLRLPNLFASLDRKARRATRNTRESRAIDRELASVERRKVKGAITLDHSRLLKRLLFLRRKIMVIRWQYAFLRGELPSVIA